MKKITSISCIIFFVLLSAIHAQGSQSPSDIEKQIRSMPDKEAHKLFFQATIKQKQQLPKRVNSFLLWIDTALEEKELFNVYYIDEKQLNIPLSAVLTELTTMGKTRAQKQVKSNPAMRLMVEREYKIIYLYFGKNKELLHRFVIRKDDIN